MDVLGGFPVLTTELAQEIARDIGRITGFNVLITDRDAVVIGCGDSERVGTVHEASFEVLRSRRPATHAARQAGRMKGVKPGMSLPIIVGEEAIGTVCLTGDPEEVHRFGLVVQRQTEILLEEAALLRSRMLHERVVDDFVRDIVFYDPEAVDARAVDARAAGLGLSAAVPRTAVLLQTRPPAEKPGNSAAQSALQEEAAVPVPRFPVLRTIREVFRGSQDVAGETGTGRFTVLTAGPAERSALLARCENLLDLLHERHGLEMQLALGEPGSGTSGMHNSCCDAATAMYTGPSVAPGRRIFAITDLRVPQLVASAVGGSRSRYARSVLGELLDQPDWPTLRATLIGWAEGGFSLVRAAEQLPVHRNTLIYRLEKISRLSGADVRDPKRALAMYLACVTDLVDLPE